MRGTVLLRWAAVLGLIGFVLVSVGGAATCSGGALDERLAAIQKRASAGADAGELEKEALGLLQEFKSPRDKGKVYAHIAAIYYKHGLNEEGRMAYPGKVVEYCQQALKHPLELKTSAELYMHWGLALGATYYRSTREEYAKARPQILAPYLIGLKLLLDNKIPREFHDVPVVEGYDCPFPEDPICQELRRKQKEQMAARKKGMALMELAVCRWRLESSVVTPYVRIPHATDEFKRLAAQTLKDDKVVKELVAALEEHISKIRWTERRGQVAHRAPVLHQGYAEVVPCQSRAATTNHTCQRSAIPRPVWFGGRGRSQTCPSGAYFAFVC